ncbi:gp096 [Rhodococcus phage ReqiDocB7]|uniref:gp096 n=1 Tax=Rhodococcus phage ReqiDocB7 TaxID=691966 RepID=UPI0001CDD879|nr:gp096 [Rhodococcus phage ReqiDocB7]ADD80882.1 gp096 [Rhodococcus phage ReqiDocB7]
MKLAGYVAAIGIGASIAGSLFVADQLDTRGFEGAELAATTTYEAPIGRIEEDSDLWDCETMGNGICGEPIDTTVCYPKYFQSLDMTFWLNDYTGGICTDAYKNGVPWPMPGS